MESKLNSHSWTIINEKHFVKHCDKSFFEFNTTGIPKNIRKYFEVEHLVYGNTFEVSLVFRGINYSAKIVVDPLDRTKLLWNSDLSNAFKKECPYCNSYMLINFIKLSHNQYFISFEQDSANNSETRMITNNNNKVVTDTEKTIIASFESLQNEVITGKRTAWLLAPGEHGKMMDRFVETGIAAIDWWSFEFGDLNKYSSKEEIAEYMKYRAQSDHSFSNDALCLYQFSHEIKLGDLIFCKRGHTELIGVGIVITPYYHSESNEIGRISKKYGCMVDTYQERVGVKWLSLESREYHTRLPLKTLTKLNGELKKGILSLYNNIDVNHILVPLDNSHTDDEKTEHADSLSIDELKTIAKKQSKKEPKEVTSTIIQRVRDPYIAEYCRRRANGICQLCSAPAPFNRSDGTPYLESHHIVWLSAGGEDSIENTAALCPNCHRKMHIVNDPADVEWLLSINKTE